MLHTVTVAQKIPCFPLTAQPLCYINTQNALHLRARLSDLVQNQESESHNYLVAPRRECYVDPSLPLKNTNAQSPRWKQDTIQKQPVDGHLLVPLIMLTAERWEVDCSHPLKLYSQAKRCLLFSLSEPHHNKIIRM